jgi:hypothetical protein
MPRTSGLSAHMGRNWQGNGRLFSRPEQSRASYHFLIEVEYFLVMPAKAGIHTGRDAARFSWTPAFAGVTTLFQ